jgi:23S rRNA (adenine2503-C2)-methyltransferase
MLVPLRTRPVKDPRPDLASLSRHALTAFVTETLGEKRFRADQLWRWIHQRGARSFSEMSDISKSLRQSLEEKARIGGLRLSEVVGSQDGTRKLVLETWDGHRIESVIIPAKNAGALVEEEPEDADIDLPSGEGEAGPEKRRRMTVCFSTQVGCGMACGFCYTASLGLARNLSAAEIVDQIHHAKRVLAGEEITNLVAMGMGEPLANLPQLLVALEALNSQDGLGFGARRITVSTVGLVPQMKKLGELSKVNLAVSLTATTDELRDRLMPINQKYPLEELLQACRDYPLMRGRRITFEYVLLAGVNDSDEDAERLARVLRGIPCKVNLLPFNEHERSPFLRPSDAVVDRFQEALRRRGYATSVRTSRGRDASAACGQLGKNAEQARPVEEASAAPSLGVVLPAEEGATSGFPA